MKKTGFKIAKIALVLFFLFMSIFVAVYKFPDRDLDIKISTIDGIYNFNLTADEIKSDDVSYLNLKVKEVDITEVCIYGSIKSIYLKKFEPSEFFSFIKGAEPCEMQITENSLHIASDGEIRFSFSDEGRTILRDTSSSFFLERLCMLEFLFVVLLVAFIVCVALEEKITPSNRNNHGPIYECKRFIKDIRQYGTYMVYAAQTDLKAEVANSYLNRLWWILEPLFSMLVYVVVFGKVMGRSIDNYAVFVYSALLMWNFFNKTINYSVKLVRNNRDIVTKVYVPKFVLLISNMILNIFKLLFSLTVLIGLILIFRVDIGIEILWAIPAYVVMILLSFGVGMIFLHYGVYVDDLSYAVGILLNMLMFLSGTFYNVRTTLSEPLDTILMCVNPVALTIDTMRNALLYQSVCNVPLIIIWFLIAVLLCCIGVHIVYKNENGYVKVV